MKFINYLIFAAALFCAGPLLLIDAGCTNKITLASGGAYTDPVLATTDQSILDASKAIQGFLGWYDANKDFLAKYPEVGKLADQVRSNEKSWIKDAYSARDSYASASVAYKTGKGTQADADVLHSKLNAALAVLNNITAQIATYRSSHATS